MFTGIIQQLGKVKEASGLAPMRLKIEVARPFANLALGESIAINGVCLTVTQSLPTLLSFDVSHETLSRSNLGSLKAGFVVNLERALRADSLLGGHIVQGHVDGVGSVLDVQRVEGSFRLEVLPPHELLRYMVPLGSITINGVSLTIVFLEHSFAVNLVPHTIAETNLGSLKPGHLVNLEVDVVAKYLERLAQPYLTPQKTPSFEALLKQQGFV